MGNFFKKMCLETVKAVRKKTTMINKKMLYNLIKLTKK